MFHLRLSPLLKARYSYDSGLYFPVCRRAKTYLIDGLQDEEKPNGTQADLIDG
ncbi:hypothetical protein ACMV5I_06570 [Serratia sp. T13T92]|uniref:hypothetical protein n=1 Tax=Serratia sp. T13T92 TaxID=3397496 RepID=UPI0039E0AD74